MIFCHGRGKPIHHDSGNPSCCRLCDLVQLGTLQIVKISSRRQKNNCTPPPWRLCMEDLWWIKTRSTLVYYGDLASANWIILEYSGPSSLKAEVTSKGERRWKDLLKCHWVCFSPSLLINSVDLYSAERRLGKEKCSFYCVLFKK